jgi:transposase
MAVCWTTSAQVSRDIAAWAIEHNVELAFVPFYASWLNRIEAQFTALRYFAIDGDRFLLA